MIKYNKTFAKYLLKKGILKKGLVNFYSNEKEIKEFKALLYRINKQKK